MVTQTQTKHNRLFTHLSTLLWMAFAVFILTLTAKVGMGLSRIFEVSAVIAAPEETIAVPDTVTGTPLPEYTATPPAPTATPLPPTSTPAPTATPQPEPVTPYLIAGNDGINVRTGPGLDYEVIGMLVPGAEADIVGFSGNWWTIDINGGYGWVFGEIVTAYDTADVPELDAPPLPTLEPTATPIAEETPLPVWSIDESNWIDVDLSEQRLTAYKGQTAVKTYLVSTGLPQTPTPVGQFRIWIKLRTDDMAGANYYIKDVPWVMYFYEGYGLHGVTWHANFGHQMSHGCVNQPNDMAEWLFNFASVGTLVNVHE